jgi:hypothetical protein
MNRHPLPLPVLGICFFVIGVLLLLTSLFPQKNSLTKTVYWLWTIAPRVGSITDEKWVMINGIGMLVGGLLFLVLWVFRVI